MKKLTAAILAFIMILSLAACGKKEENNAPKNANKKEKHSP